MILRSAKRLPPLEDKVQLKMEQQQGASYQPTEVEEHIRKSTEPLKPMDTRSRSSRSSRTSTSSAAVRARAKAVAARAQIAYAEKEAHMMKQKAELEASMMKQKADLDASLHILQVERAAAVASAEAAAYEEEERESDEFHVKTVPDMQPVNVVQRTCEYVQQHSRESFTELPFNDESLETKVKPPLPSATAKVDYTLPTQHYSDVNNLCFTSQKIGSVKKKEAKNENDVKRTSLNLSSQYVPETQVSSDLTKYLIRREMVSSGLLKFDDCPENYWAWKASFVNSTRELNLTAREELDLMVKWLGKDSSEQVKRIRSVHVLNATAAISMAWQRLEECYGAPEVIENALLKKIENLPKLSNKDNHKLRELGDILLELECAKADGYLPGLAYLDTPRGVNPIVEKLPISLQDKWIVQGSKYKEDYQVAFPPFVFFSQFVRNQAKIRNDPSFSFSTSSSQPASSRVEPNKFSGRSSVNVHRTEVSSQTFDLQAKQYQKRMESPDRFCPIHRKPHPLKKCRTFRERPIEERISFLKENRICFRCCDSTKHIAKNCKAPIKCSDCNSVRHVAALHSDPPFLTSDKPIKEKEQCGEQTDISPTSVTSKCTEICGESDHARSCSKICLVTVYPAGKREKAVRVYAVLDEQSNRSLAKTEFFNLFKIEASFVPYTIKTCAGVNQTSGRRAINFMVESIDGLAKLSLPTLIECDMLPDDRTEIPSPDVAQHYPHLRPILNKIPSVDPDAPILLLLGRDILRVHKVREQLNGPNDTPYAQRLDLGWVIVGEVCLGTAHRPLSVNVYRTHVHSNGRTSYLTPCPKQIQVKECIGEIPKHLTMSSEYDVKLGARKTTDNLGCTVFQRTQDDDKPGLSVEDNVFLEIMDRNVFQDSANSWVAPLPFRSPRSRLPNNRDQAMKRLTSLRKTLDKKPEMKRQFIEFMQKLFDNDHAEHAPPVDKEEESWYLPMFGVYHPQKPDQIRVVFDSSAEFEGMSLNKVLLSGPDLNNTLLGVLMRFRKESIAVTADVQQMFYCFVVREDHRDYLRFLWYEDNNLEKRVTEYRMKVHVFGNSPSPAVAIYCMRRAALQGENDYGIDAKHFVVRNFYVDDGLTSVSTSEEAVDLLKNTQRMLAESNLRLHKIASNSKTVMEAFPKEDHAKDLKDLDLGVDELPVQHSLGLSWNLETDSFNFQVNQEEKPFTRRGILSTVNSLFDPLGFLAPVIVRGKALLRELSSEQNDWDAPLSKERQGEWNEWRNSLMTLEHLQIKRPYVPVPLSATQRNELCFFSDASTVAIGAVAYLRVVDADNQCQVGFVMGKAKLAPHPAHTIPRLELCAAVLAVEMYETIRDEIDEEIDSVRFFTDSRVVLGYIHNVTKRFYLYVANRVTRIRKSTHPDQWCYVNTNNNPADIATRAVSAERLQYTRWFFGPQFLLQSNAQELTETFELVEPDAEIRPDISVLATKISAAQLTSHRFERFSSWKVLCKSIARLIHVARSYHGKTDDTHCKGWHNCTKSCSISELTQAKNTIIRSVQHETFKEEFECLKNGVVLAKRSLLRKLNPVIDENGLLRVGGRVSSSDLSQSEKHPLIIPHKHHVAILLVRHYHNQVAHQGRHFTDGAIRAAGFWIIGSKRLVSNNIHNCVICRKLRGKLQIQRMADLPADRLSPEPPFTNVGIDVFGPWSVVTRRTRGGSADSKRWAVIFVCMSVRAVHIELIESMSTPSFINALRRFFSIRGPAKLLRSDRGTNFVGACKELKINVNDTEVNHYLKDKGCTWIFNPPHASHMGGSWERLIGVARRILDGMLIQKPTRLTHEVLATLMAEVMAIINARPLVPVSTDPEAPEILTPALLLTQKRDAVSAPAGNFDTADLHLKQWKQVQCLADTFWKRWRREYLSTLQNRKKWLDERPNVNIGDVVLLKESQAPRNNWPVGLVVKTFPSEDKMV